jgi:hypothetical protein
VASCNPWPPFLPRISGCLEQGAKGLKQVVVQPALSANNTSKLLSVRQTKISSLDPPLTSVWPAHASKPFSAFFDPPIQLTRSGPCG